jgi:phosphatidylglycerol phospholipase C
MSHDPSLDRTTDSKGLIKERPWHGKDGLEHVQTIKEPKQNIPTFAETIALLMKEENAHVKFNVDVKVQNDPDRLFSLMHEVISSLPNWETALAPRLVIGLWHPRFIPSAKTHLRYCSFSYIGHNPYTARQYFWNDVDTFSVSFSALTTTNGQRFVKECKAAGKQLMVWTVNEPEQMMEAVRWGVDGILTDVTKTWLDLRASLQADYDNTISKYGRIFLWKNWYFYSPVIVVNQHLNKMRLERVAGPFDQVVVNIVQPAIA